MRKVIWFSCGAASAVALWLHKGQDVMPVYCDTGGEHKDNKRFLKDVEKWTGFKVTILKNDNYKDHFDVIEKERYVNGAAGAKCTGMLKKYLRFKFQLPDDLHTFGYTADKRDMKRAKNLRISFPELDTYYPLIEKGITKERCYQIINQAGIELPTMYKLGYDNNNCIGCVKGGMKYWNKIRKDFPEQFDKMSKLERDIGRTCITKDKKVDGKNTKIFVFLDELDPNILKDEKEIDLSCDFVCQSMYAEVEG